ncbi:MAG: RES family NAD+ phosphorylase [Planctomycetaceae bacterium]
MNTHKPEPGVQELFDAIRACIPRAVAVHDVVYRSVAMRQANQRDFLSGVGAATYGGRWNPRGIEAAYASLSIVTAVQEAYQNLLSFGFPTSGVRPRVFAGAKVKLQAVLDLTDKRVRRLLDFTLAELLDEPWREIQDAGQESWTQAIGRGAHAAGFEGLLAPSARDRPTGANLVIFPQSLRTASKIEILGKGDLPPHPSSPK